MKSGILLVDDEKSIRELFSRYLTRAGYEIQAVATLAEARARLADPAQAEATSQLERALWGDGDAEAVRRQLKRAFIRGPSWRAPGKPTKPLLPPLYPER